jgi:hypothetical protein
MGDDGFEFSGCIGEEGTGKLRGSNAEESGGSNFDFGGRSIEKGEGLGEV